MAVEGDYDYFRNVSDLLTAAANLIFLRNMSIQRSELAAWGHECVKQGEQPGSLQPSTSIAAVGLFEGMRARIWATTMWRICLVCAFSTTCRGISLACDLQAKGCELRVVKVPGVKEQSVSFALIHVCLTAGNTVTATAGSFASGCDRGATKPERFRRNHALPEYLLTPVGRD